MDSHGRLLCEVDVAGFWAAVGPCLALHRAELHALLREAAGEVPIRLGLAAEHLAQRDGIVAVEFSNGTSGEYDLVVGADGIHSAVRRLTFGPAAVPRIVAALTAGHDADTPSSATQGERASRLRHFRDGRHAVGPADGRQAPAFV